MDDKRGKLMNVEKYAKIMVWVSLILKVIGIFLGIATIFMLIWKVFGSSPTSDSMILVVISLLTALVCANIALTFKIVYKLGSVESDIKYIKRVLFALARDFKEFKNHTH